MMTVLKYWPTGFGPKQRIGDKTMTQTMRIPPTASRQLNTFLQRHYDTSKWSLVPSKHDSHDLLMGSQRIIDLAHAFISGVVFDDEIDETAGFYNSVETSNEQTKSFNGVMCGHWFE